MVIIQEQPKMQLFCFETVNKNVFKFEFFRRESISFLHIWKPKNVIVKFVSLYDSCMFISFLLSFSVYLFISSLPSGCIFLILSTLHQCCYIHPSVALYAPETRFQFSPTKALLMKKCIYCAVYFTD